MNRYERLFYKRHFVPVRFYQPFIVDGQMDNVKQLRQPFRHPCPCNNWKLDKKIFTMAVTFSPGFSPPLDYLINRVRKEARAEAINHIEEFLSTGMMDGEKR